MKKSIIILVAVLTASLGFGQITVTDIKAPEMAAIIKKQKIEVIKKDAYSKEVKFEDLKFEDLKDVVYKVTDLTKSEKMVTDSTGTHPEATTQWFILFKKDGNVCGFWTPIDPFKTIESTKNALAIFMAAGITQGDDEETNLSHSNDSKYVAREDKNITIPQAPNGF